MEQKQHKLQLKRDFPVDRERLYQAWTEEQQLRQWWKPLGHEISRVTNEVKEEGTVAYEFSNGALKIDGEYREALPAERLVYTWNWKLKDEPVHDAAYLLTVEFIDKGEGSRLLVTQDEFASQEAIQPHREGWEKALDELESFLQEQS